MAAKQRKPQPGGWEEEPKKVPIPVDRARDYPPGVDPGDIVEAYRIGGSRCYIMNTCYKDKTEEERLRDRERTQRALAGLALDVALAVQGRAKKRKPGA